MGLNALIERGRKIRKDLRYVHPSEGVIRLFDVYALGDAAEYHSWAATCVRFLYRQYPDDPCNRQFEEAMKNFEDPKKHFSPAPLDKMIGIMESFRTVDTMQETSCDDKSLSARINAVEQLRQQYESSSRDAVNSQKTIDLYHKWYNEALVLFAGEISPSDEYFRVFKKPDNSGNGYVLEDNYHAIQASYFVLLDMLKSGRLKRPHSEDGQRSKRPLLFISHSHEDSGFVDALVELLRTLGFNKTSMFCSSVEGYGVTEGNDIYDTLKNLFRQYDIYVVFVLSEHYYASAACLNEMGAAWVLQSNYSTILTKGFRPRDIHGAINPNKKAIVIDDARHVRSALNDFRERVMGVFELEDKDDIIVWEDNRNRFLEKVGKE